MAGSVFRPELQEAAQLGQHGLQRDPAGGVVTTERLDHVVGEEALHVVQHPRGAHVELLHLLRGQEGGLPISAGGRREMRENIWIYSAVSY